MSSLPVICIYHIHLIAINILTYIRPYIHPSTHTYILTYIHTYVLRTTYVRTYVRTYMHPSIHPPIHTYIHVQVPIISHLLIFILFPQSSGARKSMDPPWNSFLARRTKARQGSASWVCRICRVEYRKHPKQKKMWKAKKTCRILWNYMEIPKGD